MGSYALVYNTAKHAQAIANAGLFGDLCTLIVTAERLTCQESQVALPTSVAANFGFCLQDKARRTTTFWGLKAADIDHESCRIRSEFHATTPRAETSCPDGGKP